MYKRRRYLSHRAISHLPPILRDLDFGVVVAAVIIAMGFLPFASAGLWSGH